MSRFVETLRLGELAEEDTDSARRGQELVQALHNNRLAEAVAAVTRKNRKLARRFEKQYRKINRACRKAPLVLVRALRRPVDRILMVFHLAGKPPE